MYFLFPFFPREDLTRTDPKATKKLFVKQGCNL